MRATGRFLVSFESCTVLEDFTLVKVKSGAASPTWRRPSPRPFLTAHSRPWGWARREMVKARAAMKRID